MSKNADLGQSLVDQLLPLVDDLRGSLHADFGTRQYRVFIVRRRWSGQRRGDGSPTVTSSVEIAPPPEVEFSDNFSQGLKDSQYGGFEYAERCVLREVSLQYAEAELTHEPLLETEDTYYRITEGQGQKQRAKYYMLDGPPTGDRNKTIGWILHLRRAEIQE